MSLGRVALAPPERKELERRARSRSLAVESVRRASHSDVSWWELLQ